MPLSRQRLETLQFEHHAEDLLLDGKMLAWSEEEVADYFASGGIQMPRRAQQHSPEPEETGAERRAAATESATGELDRAGRKAQDHVAAELPTRGTAARLSPPSLPSSFIMSALPTRVAYEASLRLSNDERWRLEQATTSAATSQVAPTWVKSGIEVSEASPSLVAAAAAAPPEVPSARLAASGTTTVRPFISLEELVKQHALDLEELAATAEDNPSQLTARLKELGFVTLGPRLRIISALKARG